MICAFDIKIKYQVLAFVVVLITLWSVDTGFAHDKRQFDERPKFLENVYCSDIPEDNDNYCRENGSVLDGRSRLNSEGIGSLLLGMQNVAGYYSGCDFLQFWKTNHIVPIDGESAEKFVVLASCWAGEGDFVEYTDILTMIYNPVNDTVKIFSQYDTIRSSISKGKEDYPFPVFDGIEFVRLKYKSRNN